MQRIPYCTASEENPAPQGSQVLQQRREPRAGLINDPGRKCRELERDGGMPERNHTGFLNPGPAGMPDDDPQAREGTENRIDVPGMADVIRYTGKEIAG